MIPPDWLLEDITPASLIVCDDPAEMLARAAAAHGAAALEAASGRYGSTLDGADPDDVRIFLEDSARADADAYIAQMHARLAWRFAATALTLAAGPDPDRVNADALEALRAVRGALQSADALGGILERIKQLNRRV